MKNLSFSFVMIVCCMSLLSSCTSDCTQTIYYSERIPVYSSLQSLRDSVTVESPKSFHHITRIEHSNQFAFLLEENKGVHIVDFSDPNNIKKHSFLVAPRSQDIRIVGSELYLAQANDLVTFNISDPTSIVLVNRLKKVFNLELIKGDSTQTGFVERDIVKTVQHASCANDFIDISGTLIQDVTSSQRDPFVSLEIRNKTMYSYDGHALSAFDISSSTVPSLAHLVPIFFMPGQKKHLTSTDDLLFVGLASNIATFNIGLDPNLPRFFANHSARDQRCGRFYAHGSRLFTTQFNATNEGLCESSSILGITNIHSGGLLTEVNSIPFHQPQHISFYDSTLLLCDGSHGFELHIASQIRTNFPGSRLGKFANVDAKESLLLLNQALIWGEGGLHLFNTSDPKNIRLESTVN